MIKITPNSKLYIWGSSPEVKTGGAEVIQLLASTLKRLGVNCGVFNWAMPMYKQNEYFKQYYDINCWTWEEIADDENVIIFLPESMIEITENLKWFVETFKHAQFMIWWLSVNNVKLSNTLTSTRKIVSRLKHIEDRSLNLCESDVIMNDLKHFGLNNVLRLSHGVHESFYNLPTFCQKQDSVMYSGIKLDIAEYVEKKLIPIMPDVKFDKLEWSHTNYKTKEDMCQMFDRNKVYIDFAEFTGREMMPREAVVRNCALLIANRCCSISFEDYPIPEEYKVDIYGDPAIIADKIRFLLNNYNTEIEKFKFFKNKCLGEPLRWMSNIQTVFGNMIPKININYINDGHTVSYSCI